VHPCIRASVHPCIRASVHPCIRASVIVPPSDRVAFRTLSTTAEARAGRDPALTEPPRQLHTVGQRTIPIPEHVRAVIAAHRDISAAEGSATDRPLLIPTDDRCRSQRRIARARQGEVDQPANCSVTGSYGLECPASGGVRDARISSTSAASWACVIGRSEKSCRRVTWNSCRDPSQRSTTRPGRDAFLAGLTSRPPIGIALPQHTPAELDLNTPQMSRRRNRSALRATARDVPAQLERNSTPAQPCPHCPIVDILWTATTSCATSSRVVEHQTASNVTK
jgi:hypothetical protein